jgi:TRAP-type C4-dicarboxylate transport system substrate-binding protein
MTTSFASGGIVVTKKAFDKLPAELQRVLTSTSQELQDNLIKLIRADDDKALARLETLGLQVIDSPPDMVKDFTAEALAIRTKLDAVYTHAFRAKVEKLLGDYRAQHK